MNVDLNVCLYFIDKTIYQFDKLLLCHRTFVLYNHIESYRSSVLKYQELRNQINYFIKNNSFLPKLNQTKFSEKGTFVLHIGLLINFITSFLLFANQKLIIFLIFLGK